MNGVPYKQLVRQTTTRMQTACKTENTRMQTYGTPFLPFVQNIFRYKVNQFDYVVNLLAYALNPFDYVLNLFAYALNRFNYAVNLFNYVMNQFDYVVN